MATQAASITSAIEERTTGQRLFVSVSEGWKCFLFYLQDRNGADLRDGKRLELIASALDFVECGGLEKTHAALDKRRLAWFRDFEAREDVREAFARFMQQRIPGLHRGAIEIADDFDAPLPDEFWAGAP